MKRTHLELGGKAPVVVFDDADLEAAAEGIAVAGYFNAGQDCTAATRVLAAGRVHEDFTAALAEQAKDIKLSNAEADDDAFYIPPVNNAAAARPRRPGWSSGRPRTRRWSPAASGSGSAATSTRRRSSTTCARTTS